MTKKTKARRTELSLTLSDQQAVCRCMFPLPFHMHHGTDVRGRMTRHWTRDSLFVLSPALSIWFLTFFM